MPDPLAQAPAMVDAGQSRPALILSVAAVIAAGIAVRFVPLGLPAGVVKYAGSTLWGAMVYGLVACIRPAMPVHRLALIALGVSAAVEFFRLVQTPWLDAFRLTLAGQLLLGRVFSLWNLLAYAVGIAVAAALDAVSRRPAR
ncbi:hypothetical protein HNR00_004587 [Methylorubrum rhodinum]|uniref:DUF2809 domain-containing protein n=2 Tax=Methylorubrum rhodinum TaxID=29428 RepID=A0A840ZR86_9HYPH|nr:hypothetical protein [Methylorubrum rhodinum]